MSKILDISGGMFYYKQLNVSTYVTLLGLSVTISLRRINQDNLNEQDDYGKPFSEQQYMHGSFKSLCLNTNPLVSLIPPESPQILDIYSVVVL